MHQGHVLHCDQQFAQIRAAFQAGKASKVLRFPAVCWVQVEDPEDILKKNNIDLQAAERLGPFFFFFFSPSTFRNGARPENR